MAVVPVVRKLVRAAEPWLDAPVLLPWLATVARLAAGGYAAASFAFFAISPEATLRRALIDNALSDSEQRRLTVFLAIGMTLALAWGARAVRHGRDAVVAASWEAFVAAPLALWPLYEAVTSLPVRFVTIAAFVALAGFALHRFATRTPSGSILDRLDGATIDRAGAAFALVLGLAYGCALGWLAAKRLELSGAPLGSRALVFANAVAGGAAAAALFGIARRRTGQPAVSLLLAVAYLLHPTMLDLAEHAQATLPFPALLLAFVWMMETDRASGALSKLLFAGALVARPDAGLALAAYAGFLLLESRHVDLARRLFAIAAATLVVVAAARGKLDPTALNVLHHASDLGSAPDKWELLAVALFPVAFLPFVAPRTALLVVPGLAACVIGTAERWSIDHGALALLHPLLFIATAAAIGRFRESRARTALAMTVVLATCLVTAKVTS